MKTKSLSLEIIEAVYPESSSPEKSLFNPFEILRKAQALKEILKTEKGQSLKIGAKRVLNILQAEEKKMSRPVEGQNCCPGRFKENSERHLYESLLECQVILDQLLFKEQPEYEKALEELTKLVPSIDEFFLKVTVNSPDPLEKSNRLELLASLRYLFHFFGDFKKLEG